MKIVVINGPCLNFLGIREPEIYGTGTYSELVDTIEAYAKMRKVSVSVFQSNHEGNIVDEILNAYYTADALIINAAAYSHTSVAVFDAIKAVKKPTVCVHLTDPMKREEFRKTDFVRLAAEKTFAGFGTEGYIMAMDYLIEKYGD